MKAQSKWLSGAGIAVLGFAVLFAMRPVGQSGIGGSSSGLTKAGGNATTGIGPDPAQERPHLRPNAGHGIKIRKVELNPNDYTELDWSVDELDEFLKTKSSQITSKEMVSLLVYLLPAPVGASSSPSRLKAGSIQLRDQVRLCMKYLETKDQQSLLFLFLTRYNQIIGGLDEYRRDAVEQMPHGAVRANAMSGYFYHKYTDISSIREMLASDELPNLRNQGGESLRDSDYAGAVNGVSSSLTDILERGDASTEEIVLALKASKLDETIKINMIRQIEKRGAEVEILRNRAKSNR